MSLPVRLLLLWLHAASALGDHVLGFNYGSHWSNGSAKTTAEFQRQFRRAQTMQGSPAHARLFTTVQHGTKDDIIAAIQPAIQSQTSLLLGMWPTDGSIEHEITALNRALNLYGQDLIELIAGISVGNEDLYRSADGRCDPDCGADAVVIERWVNAVRSNISCGSYATALASKKIGHVDTVHAWTADSPGMENLIAACDFIGVTMYPFLGGVSIQNSARSVSSLLQDAHSAAGSKPIFVAETGWPWAGTAVGQAQAGPTSMKQYWDSVACNLLAGYDTWWYQLEDDAHDGNLWGVLESSTGSPRFDTACMGRVQR